MASLSPNREQRAAAKLLLARRAKARITSYRDDPVGFAVDILHLPMWDRLEELLTAIRDYALVTVRAGRKVSKSTGIVIASLWWATARGGRVLMSSSSFPQVKHILWSQLAALNDAGRLHLTIPLDPSTGIATSTGGSILARTAERRENMQGYSGHDALYLVDEASALKRDIMEAIEGNVAGGGTIILAGNPTRLSGPYYDTFHSQASAWHGIRISSRESPNVKAGRIIIPGLATPEWIAEAEAKYGPDSPYVSVHVDGDFPIDGANNVVPLALAQEAERRWHDAPETGELRIGVDPARGGDDETIVYAVRGKRALPPLAGRKLDSYGVVDLTLQAISRYRREREPIAVNIDVIGIGAGAYDILYRNHSNYLDVTGVNVSENATSDQYRRLRDQVWFAARTWLTEGGAYPPDEEQTREDLIAATYRFDERGRYVVASKDEMKDTLGRSPDRADALGLAVYRPPSTVIRVRSLA